MSLGKIVESPIASTLGMDLPQPQIGLRGRLTTGFWGLFDQGIVSLGNFFTNILLARHLSPTLYGTYGLIFGILLFLNNLHGSLIAYPLSVEGASGGAKINRQFAWISLIFTAILAIPIGGAIAVASWATGIVKLAPWIACALLLWQFQETLRRSLMAEHRYRDAVWGDAISYLGQAGGIWYLTATGIPSLENIFLVMAITSAAGAMVQFVQLPVHFRSAWTLMPQAKTYWNLGRWLVLNNLLSLLNFQAVPWVLAAFHGLGEAAKLLAMGNLLGVTHPALFGVSNLIIPAAARANETGGKRSAARVAMEYGALGALLVMPWYLALAIWPTLGLRFFYRPTSPYLTLGHALRIFVVAYVLIYVLTILTALLSGLKRSRAAFLVQLASGATAAVVTLPLARWGGVQWALVGGVASTLGGIFTAAILLRSSDDGERQSNQPSVTACASSVIT